MIGVALTESLLAQGWHVVVVVRHQPPPNLSSVHSPQVLVGDLADTETLKIATRGVQAVFHLAAKLHINAPSPEERADYYRTNVDGTRNLIEAARTNKVPHFVFFSSVNVYGPSRHRRNLPFTEHDPVEPTSFYTETKIAAEHLVFEGLGNAATVLRIAAVYGPGMKGNYLRLLRMLKGGLFVAVGDQRNRRSLVYIADVVQAALLAAQSPVAGGKTYNVTDGYIHSLRDIVHAISQAVGRKPIMIPVPATPLRYALHLTAITAQRFGFHVPFGAEIVDRLVEDIAVNGDLIQHELGFRPQYSLTRGWTQTIQEMTP
jgi:UDP-glucose 4-epimerase